MVSLVADYTLGKVLDALTDKVTKGINESVESTRLAARDVAERGHEIGLSWQIEAGRQATLAIEKCKNAYTASLDHTMDRVSLEIQNVVGTIEQLVNGIIHHQKEAVIEVASRVEQIITRFPLINKNPCLYKTTPSFIACLNDDHDIVVDFSGYFPQEHKVTAKFTIGSQTFTPTGDLNHLKCKVPYKLFCPTPSSDPSLVEGKLVLSWTEKGKARSIEHTIWFGIVPSTPGKFRVEYVRPVKKTETKEFVSSEFVQRSGKKGGGKTILNQPYEVPPEEGWNLVRGTDRFIVINKRERNSSWTFAGDAQGKVIYKVSTIHDKKQGQSGQVRFRIAFTQQREVSVPEPVSEDLSLRWRETRVIDDKSKGDFKKIVFVSFDGMHYEMSGVNSSNPFAKVANQGGKLVLCVVPPESLSFFPSVPAAKA